LNRPSPALVISVVALFVALGGTSYAITQLPKNSVGTNQLKKNAVTGAKVKDGSLSGTDLDVATLGTVPSAISANRASSAQTADRAGTAGSAGSADSARTATTAGSATNATNATMLNGKTAAELSEESKLRCPAEMKLAAGVCIDAETNDEAALYVAFQTCGEGSFRLPTQGELLAYVNTYDSPVSEEWIEPEIGNQGVYITATTEEYTTSTFDRAFPLSYRCVTAASNLPPS